MTRLSIVPCTLKEANELVGLWHRHHKPVRGHRYSIACKSEAGIHGAAIIGRPVAREYPQYRWVEVNRLVTDGTKNACSKLYGAAARVAREMGFERIITYTLASEDGASLRAAGWSLDGVTDGGDWNCKARTNRRTDQPQEPKNRWRKDLQPPHIEG